MKKIILSILLIFTINNTHASGGGIFQLIEGLAKLASATANIAAEEKRKLEEKQKEKESCNCCSCCSCQ